MDGACGDVAVVALFLCRPDDELAVLARDEVEVVALDDRADGVREQVRDVPWVPQAENLPLDRADRRADSAGTPSRARVACPAATTTERAASVVPGASDLPGGFTWTWPSPTSVTMPASVLTPLAAAAALRAAR